MDAKEKMEYLKQRIARTQKCEHKNVRFKKAIETSDGFILIGTCHDCHETIYQASQKLPEGFVKVKKC